MEWCPSKTLVSKRDLSTIVQCLTELVQDCNANCALLLLSSGQVVQACGETRQLDVTSLGALLAGNFGSAKEIARLLHEERFTAVFQQGEDGSIYTHQVANRWLLSVVFDRRTQIGLTKSLTQRAVEKLERVLDRGEQYSKDREDVVSREWRLAANRALEQALGNNQDDG